MIDVAAPGRHERAHEVPPGGDPNASQVRTLAPGLALAVVCCGALVLFGATDAVQRAAGVFVTTILWAIPFVLAGAALSAAGLPSRSPRPDAWTAVVSDAVLRPGRVPWLGSGAWSQGRDDRAALSCATLGLVIAPTVVLSGAVEPDRLAWWLVALVAAGVAAVGATRVALWPSRTSEEGRHDSEQGEASGPEVGPLDVPAPAAGMAPSGRDDFAARCSEMAGASYRLAVLGCAAVAAVAGLPPDGWVQWLQDRPVAGVVAGVALGLLFPPVPEAVGPSFVALAPFGVGTQIAFAVPALVGNVGVARRLRAWLPARPLRRFVVVGAAFAIATGVWGAVLS